MPYLIVGVLLALGYWGYRAFGATSTSLSRGTRDEVVASEAPLLAKEILDLLQNGRNPQAMHAAATELEKYGFFNSAILLHKRAEQLLTQSMPGATPAQVQAATQAEAQAQQARAQELARAEQERLAAAQAEAERLAVEAGRKQAAAEVAAAEAANAGLRQPLSTRTGKVNLQTNPLPVYQSPSVTGKIIGSIPPGGVVTIKDEADIFYQVQYQSLEGWAPKGAIDVTGSFSNIPTTRRGRLT